MGLYERSISGGSLVGKTWQQELADAEPTARLVGLMYGVGTWLEIAEEYRHCRERGELLTERQTEFVTMIDRMLEIGLASWAEEQAAG